MDMHPRQSFWQFRINWLVIGLPLAAVVASFATLFIALANPDPVIKARPGTSELRPAVDARNHVMSDEAKKRAQAPAEP